MQKFGLDTVAGILPIIREKAGFVGREGNSAVNMTEFCFFRRDRGSPEKREEFFMEKKNYAPWL